MYKLIPNCIELQGAPPSSDSNGAKNDAGPAIFSYTEPLSTKQTFKRFRRFLTKNSNYVLRSCFLNPH
jgi:hypothetical protein